MEPQVPRQPPPTTTTNASWVLKVQRRPAELVSPARPTPREVKMLSDIDDQQALRFHIPFIFFFRRNPSMKNIDPVEVIRKALSEALVYYYPFSGRLREGPRRKLMVDCSGEGVVFVEADADVALDDFLEALYPPFPCFSELLLDPEGSSGMLNTALLLVQVTRLKCGGFIFAIRFNHVMCDAVGWFMFFKTLGELARGAHAPSVSPVWDRHLLNARVPPNVTHVHREYDEVVADIDETTVPHDRMAQRSFFFGPREFSALRRLVPADSNIRVTDYELLTSFLWRCRTIAMRSDPKAETRVICIVNARPKLKNPSLPLGYYGNVSMLPVAITTAKDLIEQPLEFALRLVQGAKSSVTEEYVRSVADFMATRGRPYSAAARTFTVTDLTRVGFRDIDFGWGTALYGGPAKPVMAGFPTGIFLMRFENEKGETGTMVPICLPEPAMERFVKEVDDVLSNEFVSDDDEGSERPKHVMPSLNTVDVKKDNIKCRI